MLNQTLLIIDDSPDVHDLVGAWLADDPVAIHAAYDGGSGIAMAAGLRPDLILLDVEMPGMDGFTVCAQLKADPALKDVPVVFLSGASDTDERRRGLDMGAVDYVTKPFDPADLRARVSELLIATVARHAGQSQTAGAAPSTAAPAPVAGPGGPPTEIVSTFDSDPVMAEVLPEFIANLSGEVATIRALLDQHELEGLREALHQLKGAGGSYGFQALSAAAAVAERDVKAGAPLDTVAADVQALVALVQRVRGYRPNTGPTTEPTSEVSHER